jgi:hypothetical protein
MLGTLRTLIYTLFRLSPAGTALAVLDFYLFTPQDYILIVNRLLRLLAVLVCWNMTEGAMMLWIKARKESSPQSRGFGVVTIGLVLTTLFVMQAFRAQVTQQLFLVLLAVLALRGMSRSGWEQGRPHVSVATSTLSHCLLAGLSFALALGEITPQAICVAIAVGTLLGAVEMTWHADALSQIHNRWVRPMYRVCLAGAPALIGTLALLGYLERSYLLVYLLLPVAAPVIRRSATDGSISRVYLRRVMLMYLTLMGIMILCRVYS